METHQQYLLSQSIFLYFFSTRNSLFLLIAYFVSGNKCWFLIRFGHIPVGPPATINLMGKCYSLCDLYSGSYSSNQVTCYLSSLPLYTAAVGTVWSLLGSPPNGKAVLYTFQKTFNPVGRTFSLSMHAFFIWLYLGVAWDVLPPLLAYLFTSESKNSKYCSIRNHS